jgi:proline iminopeptidase
MKAMARRLPDGHLVFCPNGSHLAMYDDQGCYFPGLIGFLKGVERGTTR